MTKEELVGVLNYAYALWSKHPPQGEQFRLICRAWWDSLQDLEVPDVQAALVHLSGEREFLARPAQVRRLVIDTMSPDGVPPSPEEAWEIWLDLASRMNHGTAEPTRLHPVVASTIRKLRSGDTRDRQHFIGLYQAERDRYDLDRYAP